MLGARCPGRGGVTTLHPSADENRLDKLASMWMLTESLGSIIRA